MPPAASLRAQHQEISSARHLPQGSSTSPRIRHEQEGARSYSALLSILGYPQVPREAKDGRGRAHNQESRNKGAWGPQIPREPHTPQQGLSASERAGEERF